MPEILTVGSEVTCPHGGRARLSSSNRTLFTNNKKILLQSDIHKIDSPPCGYYDGSKYSPCLIVKWSKGSRSAKKNGIPLLTRTSKGKCLNGESRSQGDAIIQPRQKVVFSDG